MKKSSVYKVAKIEFLTHTPENQFKGDPVKNKRLQEEWSGVTFDCHEHEPEDHLGFILNLIEDNSGMLVGCVELECLSERHPRTPGTWSEEMPSLSGRYPKGWVWSRNAFLID